MVFVWIFIRGLYAVIILRFPCLIIYGKLHGVFNAHLTNLKMIKRIIYFLCIGILFFTTIPAISFFGDDEAVIWQGTRNNYFKYVAQDTTAFGKNDHPVVLKEQEIKAALSTLEYTKKKLLGAETITPVFSYSQIQLLGQHLTTGLKQATPEQDIIFVIGGKSKKLLILTKSTFLAGRAFYKSGKLNIIIGEFDFPRNDALEKVLDPGDTGEIAYSFDFGSRTSASRSLKKMALIGIPGVMQKKIQNKPRPDWFEIDLKSAAAAALAKKDESGNPDGLNQDKALAREGEAAKMARERRAMRAEMARLRKAVKQRTNDSSTSEKRIEERITTLDQLLEKKLISQEEYAIKRKEILNDI